MSPSRGSMRGLLFGVASMAAIACGREEEAAQVGSVSLTSAKAEVPTEDTEKVADDVCLISSDEAASPTRGTVLIPTILLTAMPPTTPKQKKVRAVALKEAIALREAIASVADAGAAVTNGPSTNRDVPAPEKSAPQVTTTSAAVPRAEPALAHSRVAFESHLSGDYKLERLRMLVDGVTAYDARAPGDVELAPGDHVVEVIADYRLNDPLFTYVDDYRVELRSTEVVPASRAASAFVATARPTGGVTTPMNKRAALAWRSFPAR
jgi:hypothetical protein